METGDLWKLMNEILAVHKELEHHVVRMMERQADLEASRQEAQAMIRQGAERQAAIQELVKQVVENNIRMGRILETHDYDIEELDARLLRLEERRKNGSA